MNTRKSLKMLAFALSAGLVAAFLNPIPATAIVICDTPDLPPGCGEYRTPQQVHAEFANPDPAIIELILSDASHSRFVLPIITPLPGGDELEEFQSTLQGLAEVTLSTGATASLPFTLSGPVQVITAGKTGNETGTFDTEMISMSLTGDVGGFNVHVRESPIQASSGQTSINEIGGGQFQIDSFFDVFTEVSVDGGAFVSSAGSAHVDLVPEPCSAVLVAIGIGAFFLRGRRRPRH